VERGFTYKGCMLSKEVSFFVRIPRQVDTMGSMFGLGYLRGIVIGIFLLFNS
jgi:hypothetical protein